MLEPVSQASQTVKSGVFSRRRAGMMVAAAALGASIPAVARAQTKTIRVGSAVADSYLIPFVAQEMGFFARAGLSVEISALPNAQVIVQACAANAIDLGMADMVQVASAYNHGVPLGFFAGGGLYSTEAPTTLLCSLKSGGIGSLKELEGQTLGMVAINSLQSLAVFECLHQAGVDLKKVKTFELGYAAMVPALQRGSAAAVVLVEPFLTYERAYIRVLAQPFDAIAKHLYIGAWFTTQDWAAKNPDDLRMFKNAIYDAGRWANTHQAETLAIIAKLAKFDLDKVRTMSRVVWATGLDPKLMQPVLDVGYAYKALEKPVVANTMILKT